MVKGYLTGEPAATASLVAYAGKYFKAAVAACFKNRSDHEDIVQECWIYAIKMIPKWNPERGSFSTYLKWIVRKAFSKHAAHVEFESFEIPSGREACPTLLMVAPTQEPELDIELESRFRDQREVYTVRRVCMAVYLGEWERKNEQMIQEISRTTCLRHGRIRFLADYAIVLLRTWALKKDAE